MQFGRDRRKTTETRAVQTQARDQRRRTAMAESMINVITASSMTKVELTPTTASVRKKSADQKLDPGICAKASGYVMKPKL